MGNRRGVNNTCGGNSKEMSSVAYKALMRVAHVGIAGYQEALRKYSSGSFIYMLYQAIAEY